MASPLDKFCLQYTSGPLNRALFKGADPQTMQWFCGLWDKYQDELIELSMQLSPKASSMASNGYGIGIGDIEGEMLYILVREFAPELVYEISPNAGYSSNYLLAAVSKNDHGRIEGFDIIPDFFGKVTNEVIRDNLIDLCDFDRYHLNIGDARLTVLERLSEETPDFLFLDSCHEDFFAEFYIKALLPRSKGIVFIEDIAWFDPRPEYSTEAYYALSFFQETNTEFLTVGTYEDGLNDSGIRSQLKPRRPIRSDSVLFTLPDVVPEEAAVSSEVLVQLAEAEAEKKTRAVLTKEHEYYPLNAMQAFPELETQIDAKILSRPEDRYVSSWYCKEIPEELNFISLMALYNHLVSPTPRSKDAMVDEFTQFDSFAQILILEMLITSGQVESAVPLFELIDESFIRGADLPCRLARIALAIGRSDMAPIWLDRGLQAADISIAVGYRNLLDCASLLSRVNKPTLARQAFKKALSHVHQRMDPILPKASQEVFTFCLKHPSFFPQLRGAGLDKGQWTYVIQGAFKVLLRKLRIV